MKFFRIPYAIGLTIDDMGWQEGQDDRPTGPPRLNSKENPSIEFYDEIISMGKACGTRVQGSFVMSEFDRENICAKACYNKPQSPIDVTEKGLNWTYEKDDSQVLIMNKVKEENAYLELGLHGVRHGHFEDNKWHCSEWAKRPPRDEKDRFLTEERLICPWDSENKTSEVIADCYTELLRQYFTEEELPFPESFAPPTHVLYFDNNDLTTGNCLSKRGVKYCNTKITGGVPIECPILKDGVVDHGMHILDRRSIRAVPFDDSSHVPSYYPRKFPWIEAHFKDFWYTGNQWSHYLYNINKKSEFVLAKNTEQVHSQYFYNKYAKIINLPGKIILDTRNIPQEAYEYNLLSSLVLKVPLGKKEHISEVNISNKNLSICSYYKDVFKYGNITIGSNEFMGRINPGVYEIKYKISKEKPKFFVDNSLDTYNIYELRDNYLKIKIYGTQTIRLKCSERLNVECKNIVRQDYKNGYMYITLKTILLNGEVLELLLKNTGIL